MIRHHPCHNIIDHRTQIQLLYTAISGVHSLDVQWQQHKPIVYNPSTFLCIFCRSCIVVHFLPRLCMFKPGGSFNSLFIHELFSSPLYKPGSTFLDYFCFFPTFEFGIFHVLSSRTAVILTLPYTSHLILAGGMPGFST